MGSEANLAQLTHYRPEVDFLAITNIENKVFYKYKRPVSSVAKHTLSIGKVWGSIPGPVKSAQCCQRSPPLRRFFGTVLLRR